MTSGWAWVYTVGLIGAGASAALIVMAWRRPAWEDRLAAASFRDGQVDQLEALDQLVDAEPGLSAAEARDRLDDRHVRNLIKELHP